jgi:hypothetical protein
VPRASQRDFHSCQSPPKSTWAVPDCAVGSGVGERDAAFRVDVVMKKSPLTDRLVQVPARAAGVEPIEIGWGRTFRRHPSSSSGCSCATPPRVRSRFRSTPGTRLPRREGFTTDPMYLLESGPWRSVQVGRQTEFPLRRAGRRPLSYPRPDPTRRLSQPLAETHRG